MFIFGKNIMNNNEYIFHPEVYILIETLHKSHGFDYLSSLDLII